MKAIIAQMRKDLFTLWPLVVLWWLVLIAATASTVQVFIRTDELTDTYTSSVWPLLTGLVCLFSAVIFFTQDAGLDSRAFWRVRPISGFGIWTSKLLLLFVVIVIPGAAAQWWLTGYTLGYDIWWATAEAAAWLLLVVFVGALAGALTGSIALSVVTLAGIYVAVWAFFSGLTAVLGSGFMTPHREWVLWMPVIVKVSIMAGLWLLYRYRSVRRTAPLIVIAALSAWYAIGPDPWWLNEFQKPRSSQYKRLLETQPEILQPPDYPISAAVRYVGDEEMPGGPVVQLLAEIQLPNISIEGLSINSTARLHYPDGIQYLGRSGIAAYRGFFSLPHNASGFAAESDINIDPLYISLAEIPARSYNDIRHELAEMELELSIRESLIFDTVDVAFSENPIEIHGKRNYKVQVTILDSNRMKVLIRINGLAYGRALSPWVFIYNPVNKEIYSPPGGGGTAGGSGQREMLFARPKGFRVQNERKFDSSGADVRPWSPSERNSLGYRKISGPVGKDWLANARIKVYLSTATKPIVHTVKLTDFRAENWKKADW